MGLIKDTVNDIFSSQQGKRPVSNLQSWMKTFSSSSDKMITTPDPHSTFEIIFEFFPNELSEARKQKKKGATIGKILSEKVAEAGTNLVRNVSLGLLGQESSAGVQQSHDNYSKIGKVSLMDYLSQSNLFPRKNENDFGELDLTPFTQSVTIPAIHIPDGETSETHLGTFPLNGYCVSPDSNELNLTILNTQVPLHERLFYPWMREVTLPYWSYDSQPFTTAKVTVDLTKHSDIKYVFCGCRPVKIFAQQPKQEIDTGAITRDLTLKFDYMFVTSDLNTNPTMTEKLLGAGQTLFNSVADTLGL